MSDETVQVYSPTQQDLIEVPKAQERDYAARGFKTGPAAELEAREHGWEGKLGTALTSFGNSALFGLPKLATRALAPGIAHEQDIAARANPNTALASDLAGGIAGFTALPGAGAAGVGTRIAASAFAGGTGALDRAIADGDPHLMERVSQGVGIGGVLGALGEGTGAALAKAAPAFQRATGRVLERWSRNGAFEKIAQAGEVAQVQRTLASDIAQKSASHLEGLNEPLSAGAPFPAERPFAGLSEKPPPLPERPFASALSVPEEGPEARILADHEANTVINRENISRQGQRERLASDATQRLADEPMTQAESAQLRSTYDKLAHDSAAVGETGEPSAATDARYMRDSVPEGVSPQELETFRSNRAEFNAPDPALEAAFDRAGLNAQAESLSELPQIQPRTVDPALSTTEIPRQPQEYVPTSELPEPQVDVPEPGPLAKLKGPLPARPVQFNNPLPTEPQLTRFAKQAGEVRDPYSVKTRNFQPEDWNGAKPFEVNEPNLQPGDKFALKPGKSLYSGRNLWEAGKKALAGDYGGSRIPASLDWIPGASMARSAAGPAILGAHVAADLGRRAQIGLLNRASAINHVVGTIVAPTIKGGAQVVRNLLEGSSKHVSNSYITGDVDADYKAVESGVRSAQASPEKVMQYYQERYGPLDQNGKFAGALAAHVQNGLNVIGNALPQDPRRPGLLEQPYDPPRSVKLRALQTYTGVNNPFEALSAPTYHSVATVAQAHPQTLSEVRQQLAQQLADAKVRAKLSSQQKRDISIVMGLPVDWATSSQGIASFSTIGQPPQPQPGPAPAPQKAPKSSGTVNLGAQAKQYVNNYAAPSQLNAVDPPGGF